MQVTIADQCLQSFERLPRNRATVYQHPHFHVEVHRELGQVGTAQEQFIAICDNKFRMKRSVLAFFIPWPGFDRPDIDTRPIAPNGSESVERAHCDSSGAFFLVFQYKYYSDTASGGTLKRSNQRWDLVGREGHEVDRLPGCSDQFEQHLLGIAQPGIRCRRSSPDQLDRGTSCDCLLLVYGGLNRQCQLASGHVRRMLIPREHQLLQ